MTSESDLEATARDIRVGYIAWRRGEVPKEQAAAEFDRFIARVKAEALRELLDAATDVKDEHGYVESFVPEWAVRDELDRIEKGER